MMKNKYINDYVYKFQWKIVFGGSLSEALEKFCKEYKIPKWEKEEKNSNGYFGAYFPYKNGLIWIKNRKDIPSIAHECFHATKYFFDCMSVKNISDDNEEFFAYYLAFLVKECLSEK